MNGAVKVANWYTRTEVAKLLDVSKQTVYHYGKQKKIIKIEDKHRTIREVRYEKEGVDALIEKKNQQTISGTTVSVLANRLGTNTRKIYDLMRDNNLTVDTIQIGDERYIYSLNEEEVAIIEQAFQETKPVRAVKSEFYNSALDIALHQRFILDDQTEVRIMKNEEGLWGFYLPSHTFLAFKEAKKEHSVSAAYPIHQARQTVRSGYTDFKLNLRNPKTFYFLDTLYEMCGIENIRLRENGQSIEISIKSASYEALNILPLYMVDKGFINRAIVSGELIREEARWIFKSGETRTSFLLKNDLLDILYKTADKEDITMEKLVEKILRERFQ